MDNKHMHACLVLLVPTLRVLLCSKTTPYVCYLQMCRKFERGNHGGKNGHTDTQASHHDAVLDKIL